MKRFVYNLSDFGHKIKSPWITIFIINNFYFFNRWKFKNVFNMFFEYLYYEFLNHYVKTVFQLVLYNEEKDRIILDLN